MSKRPPSVGNARLRRVAAVLLVILSAVGAAALVSSAPASANTNSSCTGKNYGQPVLSWAGNTPGQYWNDPNYDYTAFRFSIAGDPNANGGIVVDSRSCGLTPGDDLVQPAAALGTPTSLRSTQPGSFNQVPVAIRLGVPSYSSNNNGVWNGQFCAPPTSIPSDPAVKACTAGNDSVSPDDGIRVVLGGTHTGGYIGGDPGNPNSYAGGDRQILCQAINQGRLDPGYSYCSPPAAYGSMTSGFGGSYGSYRGAGWMFVSDDPSRASAQTPQDYDYYRRYFGGIYNSEDLTPMLDNGGQVNSFYMHMQIENSQPGGFGGSAILTVKYPRNDNASCSGPGSQVVDPGQVFAAGATATNSGGAAWLLPWPYTLSSGAAGYFSVPTPPPSSTAFVPPGGSVGFNLGGRAPGNNSDVGYHDFSWQMTNNGAPFGQSCPGSITVARPYNHATTLTADKFSPIILTAGTTTAINLTASATNYYTQVPGPTGATVGIMMCQAVTPCTPNTGGTIAQWTDPQPIPAVPASWQNSYGYSIPPNTPDGSFLCFSSYVTPGMGRDVAPETHNFQSDPVMGFSAMNVYNLPCFLVINPHYPYVAANRADVHAGGGVYQLNSTCVPASGVGNISGQSGTSNGQYIVSANQDINNFGSNGNPNGTSLTFGYNGGSGGGLGGYGAICRPDLIKAVSDSSNAHSWYNLNILDPISFPLAGYAGGGLPTPPQCTPPAPYHPVLYQTAGTTTISGGTVVGRSTIYVSGDLYITGNITYSNVSVSDPCQLPSLGIIATGNIYINPGVTQLDGYYYAGQQIDTCFGVNVTTINPITGKGNASQCSATLNVNGFMMAQSFRFARTGAAGSGTRPPGELFNYSNGDVFPVLYLATPPAFADYTLPGNGSLQFQGELAPLY